jgi:ankyrin repeat protein
MLLTSLLFGCATRTYDPWAEAANDRDIESARKQILTGAELSRHDINGDTPLLWATRQDLPDVVRFLLDAQQVSLEQINPRTGETALIVAVKHGHHVLAQQLLARGANVKALDHQGISAYDWAARRGDVDYLVKAADSRVSPNSQHITTNALVAAVYSDSVEAVELLVSNPDEVNKADNQGETSFIAVAKTGNLEIAELLLARGADPDVTDLAGRTPMVLAVQSGHTALVAQLLQRQQLGPGVRYHGHSLLMFAVANNDVEMVLLLLASDQAEINAVNRSDDTALHIAAGAGHAGLVDLLLHNGAAMNAMNAAGDSALFVAARANQWFVVQLLVQAGAAVVQRSEFLKGEPEIAAPLHELVGRHYLGNDNRAAVRQLEHATTAYRQLARDFQEQAIWDRFTAAAVQVTDVWLQSTRSYAAAAHYRERADRDAQIRAIGGASSQDEYFDRLPEYRQAYARLERINSLAQQEPQYDWMHWTDRPPNDASGQAQAARNRAALLSEVIQCLKEAPADQSTTCATRLD